MSIAAPQRLSDSRVKRRRNGSEEFRPPERDGRIEKSSCDVPLHTSARPFSLSLGTPSPPFLPRTLLSRFFLSVPSTKTTNIAERIEGDEEATRERCHVSRGRHLRGGGSGGGCRGGRKNYDGSLSHPGHFLTWKSSAVNPDLYRCVYGYWIVLWNSRVSPVCKAVGGLQNGRLLENTCDRIAERCPKYRVLRRSVKLNALRSFICKRRGEYL